MTPLQETVALFSKNYLPINQISVRRAVILLVTEKAEALDLGDNKTIPIRSPTITLLVPNQIRLTINHNPSCYQ